MIGLVEHRWKPKKCNVTDTIQKNITFFVVDLYLCAQVRTAGRLWVLCTTSTCEHFRNLVSAGPSSPGLDPLSKSLGQTFRKNVKSWLKKIENLSKPGEEGSTETKFLECSQAVAVYKA